MALDETANNTPHKSKRERSTRYPGVPLDDCIELCRFIEQRGLDGLPASEIATSLGYKNIKTNTFSARLSATRQFGLLNLTDDGYALTPAAKGILHPVDPSELGRLHRQILREPPIYAELIEKFEGKRLPEPTILGNILYHHHDIIAAAKDVAAQAFIDSARFAGALADDQTLRVHESRPASAPPSEAIAAAPPLAATAASTPAARVDPSTVRIELRLWGSDEGKSVRVRAPQSMSEASLERLIQAIRLHVRVED